MSEFVNLTSVVNNNANTEQLSGLTNVLYVIKCFICIHVIILNFAYFFFIIKSKIFHKNSLIYLHHFNFISLIACVHHFFYLTNVNPITTNKLLNQILCEISSAIWATSRLLHSYSILLFSLYQLFSIFNARILNTSRLRLKLFLSLPILWLLASAFYACLRFGLNTEPGFILCYDGYSTSIRIRLFYCIISLMFDTITPMILVILIYIAINKRICKFTTSAQRSSVELVTTGVNLYDSQIDSEIVNRSINVENEEIVTQVNNSYRRFLRNINCSRRGSNQFLLINILNCLSSIVTLGLNTLITINKSNVNYTSNYHQLLSMFQLAIYAITSLSSIIKNPEVKQAIYYMGIGQRRGTTRRNQMLSETSL